MKDKIKRFLNKAVDSVQENILDATPQTTVEQLGLFGNETLIVPRTRRLTPHLVFNASTGEITPTYRVFCECGHVIGTYDNLEQARKALKEGVCAYE